MERDPKKEGRAILRHYVIGGNPGETAIRLAGASDQVDYYRIVIQTIQNWSGLSLDEVEKAIAAAPDTIENTPAKPNFKPLYLQAIALIREVKS